MADTKTMDHLSDPTLNFLANLPKVEEPTMLDLDLPWIEDAPKAVPELTAEGYPVVTFTQTEDDIGFDTCSPEKVSVSQ